MADTTGEKHQRLTALREATMEMVAIAASEVGGLTEEEVDHWWDVLSDAVLDAFEGGPAHITTEQP